MAIESFLDFEPVIPESAFVAASADVIGRVTLGEESSVWYNATLRGDINEITIGPRSNVQDNAVIHLADDFGTHVGELVTVGHSAILHACTVHDGASWDGGMCFGRSGDWGTINHWSECLSHRWDDHSRGIAGAWQPCEGSQDPEFR